MKLWSICFLITSFPLLSYAQSEDYTSGDGYDDPLRRTLGLLGRIMNRMAQPGPPSDEQLHFTVNDPPDMKALSDLIRQQRKKPLSKTDRIINEELLQRLIPRVKGQTLPPRTPPTTTTKIPQTTTTTTPATTTTVATTTTTTTLPPTTTTESTTTEAPTTVTTESSATKSSKNKGSNLIVRVKSVDELQKSLEASAELNDEDSKNAQIVAEALRILLKEEGMNATKATEKLRAIAKAAISRATNKSTEAPTSTTTESTTTVSSTTTVTETVKVLKEEKIIQEADEESEALSEEEEEEEDAETEETETSTATTDPIVLKQAPVRIPEAEEEEIPTKQQENVEVSFQETGTTSTTRAPLSGQTVYNLNANANSASDPAISNVFTPVNAIVDGIGPLILPLIGYSRQALQYYPRAQGANTYQPDNSGKPVQLRSLPKGYGFGGGQEPQQVANYARGAPIQQQQTLSSLKTATNDQLIEAFYRASQTNNLATSPPRPYSRYVPNPSSVNSYYTQGGSQQNLEQLRKAFVQSNQPEYNLKQPQEIIGTTLATEPTYYGPQIDRHIGQNMFTQGVRHREEAPKSPLPVEANPDPAYAEGLKKVTAFVGDSGVMAGDENAAAALQESGLPPVSKSSNGFGGGHGPNASFDEVVKNTEQEPSYSFLG